MFKKAKWIWCTDTPQADEYGEFFDRFVWNGEKTVCRLSVNGDYTLFINGKYVESNQYGDYEHYKIYDELDLTPYLTKGENDFALLVWYPGVPTQRYAGGREGALYEVEENGKTIAYSDEKTSTRMSKAYQNHRKKNITSQLGYGFAYDANTEDDWKNGMGDGFASAILVKKDCPLFPRPIKKHVLRPLRTGKIIKREGDTRYLVDIGEETLGPCFFSFNSKKAQNVVLSYGEHIEDGRVRRKIGDRDFSFEYRAKVGENEFVNYMLRLGARYLEIQTEEPIESLSAGIIPQVYPTKRKEYVAKSAEMQAIYDVCVKTLELCAMEHYVDCIWREQCMYAFDSRNQMLSGYYAFQDGNFQYARANLLLMSKDDREDGLLSICSPCGTSLAIPSFSLYYVLSVKEYTRYSGDATLAETVFEKIRSVLDVFLNHRSNGLVHEFADTNLWNFYDWSEHAEGNIGFADEGAPVSIINMLTIIALQSFAEICKAIGKENPYETRLEELKQATKAAFFNPETGLFSVSVHGEEYTVLANSLAVLAGLTTKEEGKSICEKILSSALKPCSLSMKTFVYDAVLAVDKEEYGKWVLDQIRKDYGKMLIAGATSVWETIDGAAAFGGAGSLCHGWSAIPVYYLHILNA